MEKALPIKLIEEMDKECSLVTESEKKIALAILNLLYENKTTVARANLILKYCKSIIQYSVVSRFTAET